MGARTVVVSHSGLLFFLRRAVCSVFFFFNDTATTEIYTLSLHDALPILLGARAAATRERGIHAGLHTVHPPAGEQDRKSTRLNSSHGYISYAVFCLKKKKTERSMFPQVASMVVVATLTVPALMEHRRCVQ